MSKGFKSPGKMTKRVPEMLAKLLEKMKLASSIEGQHCTVLAAVGRGAARRGHNGVKFFLRFTDQGCSIVQKRCGDTPNT